jgi:4-diphosphocytidyl-2-C-methyl-D-erythritol kinase
MKSDPMPTSLRSFSKINLGLAIGPERADGFHSLTTLYQTLAAHDLVTVEARPASSTRVVITSNDARVPTDDRNTAFKAANQLLQTLNLTADLRIHIEKQLPVQGGLGAGSANAVATLLGLERELGAQLPGPERLAIAAAVGSDVPLFLIGGAILGTGRGEEVYPLPDLPPAYCVLALPDIGVSTPQAFRDWDALRSEGGIEPNALRDMHAPFASWNPAPRRGDPLTPPQPSDKLKMLSRALASAFCEPHSSGVFLEDLAAKKDFANSAVVVNPLLALVRTGIENDFEEVVFPKYPLLGEIKRVLASPVQRDQPECAALYAALSGSGSALFGLYSTPEAAAAAEIRLTELGVRSLRTETLPRGEYWRKMLVDSPK